MASNGKKKTTMAKLQREQRMREKRMDKQARKEARKVEPQEPEETTDVDTDAEYSGPLAASPELA